MSDTAERTVNLLNLCGQCYHGFVGFDDDNEIIKNVDDKFLVDVLNTEYQKKHYEIKQNGIITFELWFLEEESKIELVYDKVILKLPADYWTGGKPYLLESPNKIYEWYDDCKKEEYNINSRPYIQINNKYEKITISRKEKGSPITIEDVLFATRGMCLDGSRYVVNMDRGGYKIKERVGDSLLVLEPGIENFES